MRRRGASDDAVEVEMVEVDDLTGVDGAGPPLVPEADARDSDPHARRARVLRWVGAGVLAALATGAVVVNVQAACGDPAARGRERPHRHRGLADAAAGRQHGGELDARWPGARDDGDR